MKLTYWVAVCKNDSERYNIRGRTKNDVLELYDPKDYEPPKRVTIEYDSGFDLMYQCLSEGGGYWEGL